ncbi:hypothetical protein ABPG72_014600 [Tetrahymena utriculariae]
MEDIVDFRTEGTFQGQDYIVIIKAFNEQLQIHLESKYEPVWWNNTFTASYLEDLTQKTGIRRKFNEFVEAVVHGLSKRTESSNVDILTFQDLENMRNGIPTASQSQQQSGGKNSSLTSSSSSGLSSASKKSSNNKRYIIVTTEVNGERVHYPLSLNLDDIDNVDVLKQQIRKMKLEVEELKEKSIRGFSEMDGAQSSKGSFSTSKGNVHIMPGGFFLTDNNTHYQNLEGLDRKNSTQNSLNTTQQSVVDQLKSENEMLKTKIKRIEESSLQKKGAVELDNIVKTKYELEEELEMVRKESQQTIERLKVSLEEKEEELLRSRTQFLSFQKEITLSQSQILKGGSEADESTRRLREFIVKLTEQTENEVLNSRKVIQKQTKEIEKSASEIDFFKQNDRKQKQRIKQLEIELESAIKRVSTKGTTDRLYSPYTRNTPGSSASNTSNRRATSVPTKGYSPANRTTPATTTNNQNRYGQRNASNSAGSRTGISPSYQFNAKKTPTTTSATQIQNRSPGVTGNRYGSGSNTQGLNYRRNSPSGGTQSTTNTSNRYGSQTNNQTNSAINIQSNSRNRYNGSGGISGISGTQTGTTVSASQRQFGTNKTNNTATSNRLTNSNKGLSPKPNAVNTNRQSPSTQRLNGNPTLQRTNSNSRLSPASRYNLANNNNKTGNHRQSPGTRINNYLSSNDQKLMKKIDDMQGNKVGNNSGTHNTNNIIKEYQDVKVDSTPNRIDEIDQRLNKLQNLLKMAKN